MKNKHTILAFVLLGFLASMAYTMQPCSQTRRAWIEELIREGHFKALNENEFKLTNALQEYKIQVDAEKIDLIWVEKFAKYQSHQFLHPLHQIDLILLAEALAKKGVGIKFALAITNIACDSEHPTVKEIARTIYWQSLRSLKISKMKNDAANSASNRTPEFNRSCKSERALRLPKSNSNLLSLNIDCL